MFVGGRETEEQLKDGKTAGDDNMPKSLVCLEMKWREECFFLCFYYQFFFAGSQLKMERKLDDHWILDRNNK